jgi:hypothetical protein
MNKFKDSLIQQLEKLKSKVDHYLRTSSNVPYSQRGPATQRTDATDLDDLAASDRHGRDSAGAKIVYEEKKVQYMMKKL